MSSYVVKQQFENGDFKKVGEISSANMMKDISPSDPQIVADKVYAAVSTKLKIDGKPPLYFDNQDPSANALGQEIVADNMYQLKQWVNGGTTDVYFFNKFNKK